MNVNLEPVNMTNLNKNCYLVLPYWQSLPIMCVDIYIKELRSCLHLSNIELNYLERKRDAPRPIRPTVILRNVRDNVIRTVNLRIRRPLQG